MLRHDMAIATQSFPPTFEKYCSYCNAWLYNNNSNEILYYYIYIKSENIDDFTALKIVRICISCAVNKLHFRV